MEVLHETGGTCNVIVHSLLWSGNEKFWSQVMNGDEQAYTGNNHILATGLHIAVSNPTFCLKSGSKKWFTEWHYYFGPMVVHGKTGDPLDKQPGEGSAFWIIAQWWKDQGCRVVNGVGLWDYPEVETVTCAKTGRKVRIWKGYERIGPVKKL